MATDDTIGGKLATVRESLGLTPESLAERGGCDAGTVRRIESGEVAPSLALLIRLTRAMGVRLGTLLDDEAALGPVLTRRDEARPVGRVRGLGAAGEPGGLGFLSLASGKTSRHMEPFIVEVEPGGPAEDPGSSHEGEELLFVLEGTVDLRYGASTYTLGEGDSIYYDSIVPHRVRAVGASPARLLAVVYAPA